MRAGPLRSSDGDTCATFLGEEGVVAAGNLPYLSAVNQFLADYGKK